MRTGNLRKLVRIQSRATTVDTAGQRVETWTDIVRRRVSIEPLNGREYFVASGENSEVTSRIRLRYDRALADVKAYDRVLDDNVSPNVVYDIESVINVRERNRELVLMCKQ